MNASDIQCFVKEFSGSTKRGYKYFKTACSVSTPNSTSRRFTIEQPTLHNFINNVLYEIAISQVYSQADGTGIGFQDSIEVMDASILVQDTATTDKIRF